MTHVTLCVQDKVTWVKKGEIAFEIAIFLAARKVAIKKIVAFCSKMTYTKKVAF